MDLASSMVSISVFESWKANTMSCDEGGDRYGVDRSDRKVKSSGAEGVGWHGTSAGGEPCRRSDEARKGKGGGDGIM